MDPTPTPSVDPAVTEEAANAVTVAFGEVALAVSFIIVLVVVIIAVRGLLKSAEFEKSVTLVISLSILTMLAIGGAIATAGQTEATVSTALIGLAGVGLGALGAAVTSVFTDKKPEDVAAAPPEPESWNLMKDDEPKE